MALAHICSGRYLFLILPAICRLRKAGSLLDFQNALHPSEFNKLVSLGFLCEADVANLRCSEIVEFSNGFF